MDPAQSDLAGEARRALLPLALKAWAVATAALLAWGIVSAFIIRSTSISSQKHLARMAEIDATNRGLEAAIAQGARERVVLVRQVETNYVLAKAAGEAYEKLVGDYRGVSNRLDALRIYRSHSN